MPSIQLVVASNRTSYCKRSSSLATKAAKKWDLWLRLKWHSLRHSYFSCLQYTILTYTEALLLWFREFHLDPSHLLRTRAKSAPLGIFPVVESVGYSAPFPYQTWIAFYSATQWPAMDNFESHFHQIPYRAVSDNLFSLRSRTNLIFFHCMIIWIWCCRIIWWSDLEQKRSIVLTPDESWLIIVRTSPAPILSHFVPIIGSLEICSSTVWLVNDWQKTLAKWILFVRQSLHQAVLITWLRCYVILESEPACSLNLQIYFHFWESRVAQDQASVEAQPVSCTGQSLWALCSSPHTLQSGKDQIRGCLFGSPHTSLLWIARRSITGRKRNIRTILQKNVRRQVSFARPSKQKEIRSVCSRKRTFSQAPHELCNNSWCISLIRAENWWARKSSTRHVHCWIRSSPFVLMTCLCLTGKLCRWLLVEAKTKASWI